MRIYNFLYRVHIKYNIIYAKIIYIRYDMIWKNVFAQVIYGAKIFA